MNGNEKPAWYMFQAKICSHFKSIGTEATTNVRVKGVRTSHDVDVLVKTKYLGFELTWIVEAKYWKRKVCKEKVLALRQIVDDVGADRGFIISESGFQSGAIEAARNSNITLSTYTKLLTDTRHLIESKILDTYIERVNLLQSRYWSHSKKTRKKYGLRGV